MTSFCLSGQSGQSAVKVIFAFTLTTKNALFSVVCVLFLALVKVVKVISSRRRVQARGRTRAHGCAPVYFYFDHFDHLIINKLNQKVRNQKAVKVMPFLALTAL